MIYDTFLFFNELELLEIRLEELKDVGDRFVLVEATRTLSGKPKPLYFSDNKELFSRFSIEHVVIDEPASSVFTSWEREGNTRRLLTERLRQLDLSPHDIVLLSDLDEIPRAEVVARCAQSIMREVPGTIYGFQQELSYYYVNCRANEIWLGTRMARWQDIGDLQALRSTVGVPIRNGGWTTMLYDPRSLLIAQQDGLGRLTSYAYDGASNQTLKLNGRGVAITYSYDRINRQTGKLFPNGTCATLGYDPVNRRISMQDAPTGLSTYAYDLAGRLTGYIPGLSQVALSFSYDPADNRLTLTEVAAGLTTSYVYDRVGNATSIVNGYGAVTTMSYDALNTETIRAGVGGSVFTTTYDSAQRATAIVGSGSGTYETSYQVDDIEYDGVGNSLGSNLSNIPASQYTYDAVNRIASEENRGPYVLQANYQYDPAGNRSLQLVNTSSPGAVWPSATLTYDPAGELSVFNPNPAGPGTDAALTTYTYDGAGNRTVMNAGGNLTTHTWDYENRLLSISQPAALGLPAGIVTNIYSSDGLRQSYSDSTGVSTLTYDPGLQTLYRRDGIAVVSDPGPQVFGPTTERYTRKPEAYGSLVAQSSTGRALASTGVAAAIGGTASLFPDLSRNVGFALVASGSSVGSTYNYPSFAFGFHRTPSSWWDFGPLQFGGDADYYTDPTTGLIYVKARWYDPISGQWISPDPSGFGGGDWSSLYRYVENNPVRWVDSSGLQILAPPEVAPSPNPVVSPEPGLPPGLGGAAGGAVGGAGGISIGVAIGVGIGGILLFLGSQQSTASQSEDEVPCRICPPCPPAPPATTDCPPSRPHYFKKLNCCCHGCHTHIFRVTQAPWPKCLCRIERLDGTCLSDCRPGRCKR